MKDARKEKDYIVGLDIGVGSVGYAVTDDKMNLLYKGNKPIWGYDIFEQANKKPPFYGGFLLN